MPLEWIWLVEITSKTIIETFQSQWQFGITTKVFIIYFAIRQRHDKNDACIRLGLGVQILKNVDIWNHHQCSTKHWTCINVTLFRCKLVPEEESIWFEHIVQISIENWSSSVLAAVELTGLFFPESSGVDCSVFPRPEVMPGTLNWFYFQVNVSPYVPGILGRFFGGVRARGEFLMLIRKFLS